MKTPHEFKVMRIRECVAPCEMIDTPESAVAYWLANIPAAEWYDESKEAVVVLILNTRRRIIGHNLVTLGSLDTCFVHAREVFRPAIVAAGSSIVLMHNHPSGDASPSEADIKVTRDLIRAGQLLKMELIDHVIVGRESFTSLRTAGYFQS
jgi:DNA repair protein RadC